MLSPLVFCGLEVEQEYITFGIVVNVDPYD